MIAATAGHIEDAERLLRRTVKIAPDYFTAQVDLGRIYKEQDRYEEAMACFRKAIELEPNNAKPWFLLAGTLAPAALTEQATEAYRRCIELRPEHAGAWLGLGHTLKTIGRQEEGIAAYRRCIELKPDNVETYWSLANLKTFRFTDEELAQMEQRLASGNIKRDSSEVNFMFALAKAYEDREDYDTAWQWYSRGNEKQRGLVSYDPVHLQVTHDAILEVFDEALFERLGGLGCEDPSPIFVLGLPRSGSTLIEQILASHSMVEGTSELPYLARVAGSLNRNRADGINYPQAVQELSGENLRQLFQHRPRKADPAQRKDHRRPPPPAGRLPRQLPAAFRQGTEFHLRPGGTGGLLPRIPAADGRLAGALARPGPDRAVRGQRRGLREPGAPHSRVL